MITATGHVFLSKATPLAARASDGTFVLTLSVVDAVGAHAREPWCIHWSGDEALAFWTTHRAALQPGCALLGTFTKLRVYYSARVPGIDATVVSLALAPRAQNTQQTTQPSTQPETTPT